MRSTTGVSLLEAMIAVGVTAVIIAVAAETISAWSGARIRFREARACREAVVAVREVSVVPGSCDDRTVARPPCRLLVRPDRECRRVRLSIGGGGLWRNTVEVPSWSR